MIIDATVASRDAGDKPPGMDLRRVADSIKVAFNTVRAIDSYQNPSVNMFFKSKKTQPIYEPNPKRGEWLQGLIAHIEKDKYLHWHNEIHAVSVFDDVHYDRADVDMLTPAMRKYVTTCLTDFGCKLKSGTNIIHKNLGITFILPKPSVLGASPFDITKHFPRNEGDIYIFTPTQAAAYLFDHIELETAVKCMSEMIKEQPINLLKLEDTIGKQSKRESYLQAMGHLTYCQRHVVEQPGMRFKRSLGSIF